ncbi:ABC transporter [Oceaniferula spumae]|uniref:ABC transporter n=1 Tax=Oceaniferula spumae TaxID=2979115 RepID=A0AAT9FQE8_9BACT
MHRFITPFFLISGLMMSSCSDKKPTLKITGSTTVNLAVAEAAEALRGESDTKIFVDTQGGSSGGITAIGEGTADIGMASKPLTKSDRDRFPGVDLKVTQIGADAVALVVNADVWKGGVKSLTRKQVQAIYEKKITNWKDVGGADEAIVFYNKEPGRGTWEVFANYAYGSADKAPEVSHPEVGANEETRTKVATTPGAISQLSMAWADNETVYALNLTDNDDASVAATGSNIASGKYPMSRPLNLITRGEPTGKAKVLVDYMLSEPGQKLMEKHGYLPLSRLK